MREVMFAAARDLLEIEDAYIEETGNTWYQDKLATKLFTQRPTHGEHWYRLANELRAEPSKTAAMRDALAMCDGLADLEAFFAGLAHVFACVDDWRESNERPGLVKAPDYSGMIRSIFDGKVA